MLFRYDRQREVYRARKILRHFTEEANVSGADSPLAGALGRSIYSPNAYEQQSEPGASALRFDSAHYQTSAEIANMRRLSI